MPEYYFPDFPNVAVVILTMLFVFAFFLIATLIVMLLIRGVGQRNRTAPRLTIRALVTSKRTEVSGRKRASARYYATFQADSGDRMELQISGGDYGLLSEGDEGQLSFQGTRFLGFRQNEAL